MNFQQCRYVEAIARLGSFSQAAKELFVSQPNLSSSIKDLENKLGVQLFIRSNTGAHLTEEGYDFLKYVKRILGELNLLEDRYRNTFKKSFTVASHHYDFLSIPLASISQTFHEDYQEFQLVETTTKKILESVACFEADLGIIFINEENRHILERSLQNQNLNFISLGEFPTRIFLRKDHPLSHKKTIRQDDLEGYHQVRFRQEKAGLHFDEDPLEIQQNQQIIYSNDRGTVMNLLCASDAYASGLGLINSFVRERITLIPLENSLNHTLGYIYNNQKKLSAISHAFITEIKKSLIQYTDMQAE